MKAVNCGMIVRYYLMLSLVLSATYLHAQNKTVINIGEGSGAGSVAGSCVCDTIKLLGSNQASTSTTYAAVTDLTYNVEAGTTYILESTLFFDTIPNGGLKLTVDGTASVSFFYGWYHEGNNLLFDPTHTLGSDFYSRATSYIPARLFIVHSIFTASTGGTLGVQFAQVDGDGGTTTMLSGSFAQLKLKQ